MKITDTEITCLKEKGISTVLYFHDQLEEKLAKKWFKAYPPKRGRQTPDLDAQSLLLPSAVFLWKHGKFQILHHDSSLYLLH